jgi:hypothetical protein
MKHGRLADFFFVGLAVVPVTLVLGGLPQVAMLVFFPLLIAGCCFGMDEQVRDRERRDAGKPGAGRKPAPPDAPGPDAGPREQKKQQ